MLATLIPDAHFVLLESANHILLEHEPAWDVFLSEIVGFLVRTPSQVPDRCR